MAAKFKLRKLDDINEIIMHCSANGPDSTIGAKEIRDYHVRVRGWLDIGYHFVVRRDGTVEEGRPLTAVGAHCTGHNARSVGICLVGGVARDGRTPQDNFTEAQFKAAAKLVRQLQKRLPGIMGITGHNRYANKACPVFDVQKFVREYVVRGGE